MIITRTPLRISLGGGGTDLPSYYRQRDGGFLVAAAINKYVYIAAHRNFEADIMLKYSRLERVESVDDVSHPLLREALRANGIDGHIEISSMADIPAGTGLGSSGTFTVGVLRALAAYNHQYLSNLQVAELACEIEIDRLREPIGKQDQYIASVGGLTSFEFRPDESVEITSLPVSLPVRQQLEENLLLFYTGHRRSASAELVALDDGTKLNDSALMANLDDVRDAGRRAYSTLVEGNLSEFAHQLTEQWKLKFDRAPTSLHQQVDGWIESGIRAGAGGGKLVGAGGGGFLLFYADSKAGVRGAMEDLGFDEITFAFDYQGSTVVVG